MEQLFTVWGETLDKEHVLDEYPRPLMVRDSYLNLNGTGTMHLHRNLYARKNLTGRS